MMSLLYRILWTQNKEPSLQREDLYSYVYVNVHVCVRVCVHVYVSMAQMSEDIVLEVACSFSYVGPV